MNKNCLILLTVCILLSSCQQKIVTPPEISTISNSQIESLIDNDRLFYKYTAWDSASLKIDNNIKDETGEYYKIIQEDLDTYSEWEDFARGTYSKEILDDKLHALKEKIKNIDGDAYVRPGGRGNPISQEYTYKIVSFDERNTVIEVNFTSLHEEDYGELITYTYKMKKEENGWRITDFNQE